ncbi:MAG: hypothetical protein PF569_09230 [Candidatus Woesearchaeota archaeon]|jgi:hypothetical protein|nr:hypothetical protein [Candidatus Woesearchaeota archaeon]
MKYEVRKKGNNKKAIFDETGKQVSEWWYHIFMDGLIKGQSAFYIVRNDDAKESIFHKSGKQTSEWWHYIWSTGLVDGTSNNYRVEYEIDKYKTLTFDKTKFIMDQIKERI